MTRLCIVSGGGGDDVKQLLIAQAKKHFDSVSYASFKKIRIELENGKSRAFFKDTPLDLFDAVWVRAFFDDYRLGEILLDLLEETDVFLVNSTEGLQICNHKFLSVQHAIQVGVPVPDSYLCVSPKTAHVFAEQTNFPQVVKLLSGFGGKGVMLAHSKQEFAPLLDTLALFREFITGQTFIQAHGVDFRVLVIGDQTIGIRRQGKDGEWRANVSGGGTAEFIELDPDLSAMAKALAHYLDLHVCSVDFLKNGEEFVLVELNFSPGMLKDIFNSQLADKILSFIKKSILEKTENESQKNPSAD